MEYILFTTIICKVIHLNQIFFSEIKTNKCKLISNKKYQLLKL